MERRCSAQMAQPSIRATLNLALRGTCNVPIPVTCVLLHAPAHTHRGRCFCLYTGGTRNIIRNKENLELKSTLSHASKRCTPAHCMHVLHTSTKHMPPAGDMFTPLVPLVRVAPAVSPCLYLGLAAVFLCLFLLCVLHRRVLAPWFEWAVLTRGSLHKEARVAQPCSALCGSSKASRISSAAINAHCSLCFKSVVLRAPFSVFPLSFPFPVVMFGMHQTSLL